MALPTMTVRIAFATAPFAAAPTWTTVTSDVLSMHIKRGRQHELDRFEAGTATLVLKNSSGNYWPENAGGLYTGNIKIGKKVNIQATYGATTYDLYTGFIEWWRPGWLTGGGQLPVMQIHCVDLIGLLSRMRLNDAAGYAEELSGTRIGNVLDDVGWPAGFRDIDAGQQQMQATGPLDNIVAMSHIYKVCESELSIFYIAGDGDVQYEDRSHRTVAPHDTSQATFTNAMNEADLALDDKLLYNEVRATRVAGAEQVATDSTSQTAYALRSLVRSDLLLTDDVPVRNYCYYLLARFAEPAMRARQITFKPEKQPNFLWPKVLGYDISTRITVALTQGSISTGYFIESIEHEYDSRRGEWTTRWQLSDADHYLFTPDPVEDIIHPSAAGDLTTLTPSAGANYQCVDEATPDDDTSYVYMPIVGGPTLSGDLYNLGNPPYQQGTINKITITVKCRQTANGAAQGWFKTQIKTGGTVYQSAQQTFADLNWVTYSLEYALNPNTGVAWTWGQLDALQSGVQVESPITTGNRVGQTRCTIVYVTVNYTPTW